MPATASPTRRVSTSAAIRASQESCGLVPTGCAPFSGMIHPTRIGDLDDLMNMTYVSGRLEVPGQRPQQYALSRNSGLNLSCNAQCTGAAQENWESVEGKACENGGLVMASVLDNAHTEWHHLAQRWMSARSDEAGRTVALSQWRRNVLSERIKEVNVLLYRIARSDDDSACESLRLYAQNGTELVDRMRKAINDLMTPTGLQKIGTVDTAKIAQDLAKVEREYSVHETNLMLVKEQLNQWAHRLNDLVIDVVEPTRKHQLKDLDEELVRLQKEEAERAANKEEGADVAPPARSWTGRFMGAVGDGVRRASGKLMDLTGLAGCDRIAEIPEHREWVCEELRRVETMAEKGYGLMVGYIATVDAMRETQSLAREKLEALLGDVKNSGKRGVFKADKWKIEALAMALRDQDFAARMYLENRAFIGARKIATEFPMKPWKNISTFEAMARQL